MGIFRMTKSRAPTETIRPLRGGTLAILFSELKVLGSLLGVDIVNNQTHFS